MSRVSSQTIQYCLGRNVQVEKASPKPFYLRIANSIKWKVKEIQNRETVLEQLGEK